MTTDDDREGPVSEGERGAAATDQGWHAILSGTDPALVKLRRWWKHVPASPRCKVCAAPFQGLGSVLTRVIMHGQSQRNPLLCNLCFGRLRDHPGGAEVEISVLFADIRGSTGLAEQATASRFRELLQEFYAIANRAVDGNGGIVDKFLGDGVMALFIPVFTGENHARRAIAAGRQLLDGVAASNLAREGALVGAGLHAGSAFVGVLGSEEHLDFSAVGDTVNIAARLGSIAGPGELLVSRAAWESSGEEAGDLPRRELQVTGRSAPVEVVVLGAPTASTAATG